MQKLNLESLRLDSFTTTSGEASGRGTVLGRENTGTPACPISYNGTCYVTCFYTCYCDTEFECA
jgi:hypothetical protein